MARKSNILFSLSLPILIGCMVLLCILKTCQRFEPELLLEISTDDIDILLDNEYRFTGSVLSFGENEITEHGFCWSRSPGPLTDGSSTQLGVRNSKGIFTSTVFNLIPTNLYYVRAYAISSLGTVYGNERSFNTPQITLPEVSTTGITEITQASCSLGGNVTDDGGGTVTARGVCWSTLSNPTITGLHTSDGSGTGYFSSTITGLLPNTTYYTRAYATNSEGTNYGGPLEFITAEATVTDIDGNVYQTVQIGSQVWMAENLKATHYADGSIIPFVTEVSEWNNLTQGDQAFCWYDNSILNRDIYGGLYTWSAAMKGAAGSDANPSGVQGVCPNGWHLPSDAEWVNLLNFLGGTAIAGGKLKEAGFSHWESPNTGATNESQFTALPGGRRNNSGLFEDLGRYAYMWETNESIGEGIANEFSYGNTNVYTWQEGVGEGYSVRCIKD